MANVKDMFPPSNRPRVVIVAGPNGAGKSTSSMAILEPGFMVYLNPDLIARGVNPHNPEDASFAVGRVVHKMMRELMAERKSFSFETTLSGKTYVNLIKDLNELGYTTELIFFWLESPDLAVRRVAERVRDGGHNIPEETIRRRYVLGLQNFFNLYCPLVDSWKLFNNTNLDPQRIAEKTETGTQVFRPQVWQELLTQYRGK